MKYFKISLSLLVFFNLWDAFVTIFVLEKGLGRELNPIMAHVYQFGPALFLFVKLSLIALGCLIVWEGRHLAKVRTVSFLLTIMYAILFTYQVFSLAYLWHVGAFWT